MIFVSCCVFFCSELRASASRREGATSSHARASVTEDGELSGQVKVVKSEGHGRTERSGIAERYPSPKVRWQASVRNRGSGRSASAEASGRFRVANPSRSCPAQQRPAIDALQSATACAVVHRLSDPTQKHRGDQASYRGFRLPDRLVYFSESTPSQRLCAADGWSRRKAPVADRRLGRLNWADSAPKEIASGRTGVHAIAVVPWRARNRVPRQGLVEALRTLRVRSCLRPVGAGNECPAGPDVGPHGSSPCQQNALVMAPALFLGLPSRSVGSHRFAVALDADRLAAKPRSC